MKLVICEKPSQAQAIAAVLGAKSRKDGYLLAGNDYAVSWCFGHLLELAQADTYDEKYGKWRYEDLPIIPEKWKYIAAKDKAGQLKILSGLMKSTDIEVVINAADAGREGELIFRLVYEHCGCRKPIKRLWISSMEESAILDGFKNLKDGRDYERLYHAALCRAQADWIVGINASRLFSVLYRDTLSVGRVQSPTLTLLVKRENDIAAFVKEPFYTPEIVFDEFSASGEKTKDRQTAETIRAACDGKRAVVTGIERLEKTAAPPKLYDLTTLQREANRLHGFTAQQTLDYVQSLYEKKLATYPRTDSRYLTEDMTELIPGFVNTAADMLPGMRGKVSSAINPRQVINNAKVTDHHAIIPTRAINDSNLDSLPSGERDILFMLMARLICAVGERHLYAETIVTLDCEGHIFTTKGKHVLNDGWRTAERVYKDSLKNKSKDENGGENDLPDIVEGEAFSPVTASVREGFTTPPKRYTEDTLLLSMENAGAEDMPEDAERKGLGTPATRAGIIEKLVKSGFAERKDKQFIPTEKGMNLIKILPDVVKSPLLTAKWETMLKQVERGELTAAAFMEGITKLARELVADNKAPIEEYKSLFGKPFTQGNGNDGGEIIGKCPRCGGNIREKKAGFFCDNQQCEFALWRNNKFFTAKKKEITKSVAAALLTEGRVFMSGLYSDKTGKSYDAVILLDDKGGKYVSFAMEFSNGKKPKK